MAGNRTPGTVRVIAGAFRGRKLKVPSGPARPTLDRVKEALYSVLFDVEDFRVLDLFAGSGALGIEALSRGAAEAVFVDSHPEAALAIQENLRALGVSQARGQCLQQAVRKALPTLEEGSFDLIVADPPYQQAESVTRLLFESATRLLVLGGRLVIEQPSSLSTGSTDLPEGLSGPSERRYGDTALMFYERI